ncbi:hypothetical protein BT96DRAFT_912419, partial [Gymnopus androsaceus JB14]
HVRGRFCSKRGIGSGSPTLAAEETLDGWVLHLRPLLSFKSVSVLASRGSSVPMSILRLGRVQEHGWSFATLAQVPKLVYITFTASLACSYSTFTHWYRVS